ETSTYTLELPEEMRKRRIHPNFHASLLRPFVASDPELFPGREASAVYDFGQADDKEWVVESIVDHDWRDRALYLKIHWSLGDESWEPLEECEELVALDEYLALHGVDRPAQLPGRSPISNRGRPRGNRRAGRP
ncbi:hypothetical protein DFH11DRAFT_1471029, partial [Phellopilus nigrolimitatus]